MQIIFGIFLVYMIADMGLYFKIAIELGWFVGQDVLACPVCQGVQSHQEHCCSLNADFTLLLSVAHYSSLTAHFALSLLTFALPVLLSHLLTLTFATLI